MAAATTPVIPTTTSTKVTNPQVLTSKGKLLAGPVPTGCPLPDILQSRPAPLERTRWFVMGPVKSAKTHFGASIEGGFMLDMEGKLCNVLPENRKLAGACQPTTLPEMDEVIKWVTTTKSVRGPLVLDTLDSLLYDLIIPGITQELITNGWKPKAGQTACDYGSGGKGSRGWDMVTNRLLGMLSAVYAAGLGWVALGHVKTETVQVRIGGQVQDLVKSRPAINPGSYGGIYRMAEFLARTSLRQTTVTKEVPVTIPTATGVLQSMKMEEHTETNGVLTIWDTATENNCTGSNLGMPAEIILPLGEAWATVAQAYETSLRGFGKAN